MTTSATPGDLYAGPGRWVAAEPSVLYGPVKRALDIAISGTALVLLSPLLVVLAALVRVTSPGPAFFRQVRVGRGGRPFVLLKFRTMYAGSDDKVHRDYVSRMFMDDAPPHGGRPGIFKLHDDPRVTRFGAWIRRTSLDELPQLLNVLAGQMSLVGPRPALPWEVSLYRPEHHARLLVKPGIAGLPQVAGRNRLTMPEMLDLDLEYVARRSIVQDVLILLKLIPVVLTGVGLP